MAPGVRDVVADMLLRYKCVLIELPVVIRRVLSSRINGVMYIAYHICDIYVYMMYR